MDGQRTTYSYDSMGNRLTKTVDGLETSYVYDFANKLLEEVTELPNVTEDGISKQVTTYRYDKVGNLTEKVTTGVSEIVSAEKKVTTYTYNSLNQLVGVTNPDGTWQESTYDASGIRSMISENGITTEYVSLNGLVIAGYDKRNEQTEHYFYGTSLLAAELQTATKDREKNRTNLYYYLKNSHGDVIGLTDNDGTLTETYTFDAFGTLTYIQSLNEEGVLVKTDTALSRFLYAGEQYDEVTGLYYLRARRYDTTVGRFTQEDTYLGDGRNLYVYVQNNPLKYVDPSGYGKEIGHKVLVEYELLFGNPWEPGDLFSGDIETVVESLLYVRRELEIAERSFNWGTNSAIVDNLSAGLTSFSDNVFGNELFFAAGRVRGEALVTMVEFFASLETGVATILSGAATGALAVGGQVVPAAGTGTLTVAGAVTTSTLLYMTGQSAKRTGNALEDVIDEVIEEVDEFKVKNIIKKIPKSLKEHGKCDGFAKRLTKALDANGIDYKIIRVESKDLIYSDKAGEYIGKNYHYGIKIGDTVYDNMTPEGMKLQNWLDDLGLSGEFSKDLIRWDYVDEIFN